MLWSGFQGGNNAGHTIVSDGVTYKLSTLPSGILYPGIVCIIANGVVLDAMQLVKEIDTLSKQNIMVDENNLIISDNTCLILELHKFNDQLLEALKGKNKIGTTGRGIGPAYEDKVARRAIRVCDLYGDTELLHDKVENLVSYHNLIRKGANSTLINVDDVKQELTNIKDSIQKHFRSSWQIVKQFFDQDYNVLFEGAQGAMLDNDHGTYPFVTSSNTYCGQVFLGTGLGINNKIHSLGVTKAYATRVGNGFFPTEQTNQFGKLLQVAGNELGTVTGRDRRCGWLDIVLLKQTIKMSGIDSLALTKLDVMDNFPTINICTHYEYNGTKYDYLPNSSLQNKLQPVYETMEGWKSSTQGIKEFTKLPPEAQRYIKRIEELLNIEIILVSTGAKREDTIMLKDIFSC